MSSPDKLARMANQIASFFRSYPEEQAVAGVQEHIVSFWTPRMRNDLRDAVDDAALGLDPLVRSALLRTTAAASPAHREIEGPDEAGALASDAG